MYLFEFDSSYDNSSNYQSIHIKIDRTGRPIFT